MNDGGELHFGDEVTTCTGITGIIASLSGGRRDGHRLMTRVGLNVPGVGSISVPLFEIEKPARLPGVKT